MKVGNGQNLLDVALSLGGNVEDSMVIAKTNVLGLTDDVEFKEIIVPRIASDEAQIGITPATEPKPETGAMASARAIGSAIVGVDPIK